jgi:hypothetical protein
MGLGVEEWAYVPKYMEEMRNAYQVLLGETLKEKEYLEDVGIDEIITLKCILKKYAIKVWTGFILTRIGSSGKLL